MFGLRTHLARLGLFLVLHSGITSGQCLGKEPYGMPKISLDARLALYKANALSVVLLLWSGFRFLKKEKKKKFDYDYLELILS